MASTKTKYRRTTKSKFVGLRGLGERMAVIENPLLRKDLPDFNPGDTVKVHVKIKEGEKERIQIFEGVVIARSNKGSSRSFTVRKMSHGVGVERMFLLSSPKVAKIDVVQEGRVRRSKLYYLRALEGKAARVDRETEATAESTAPAPAKS